MRKKLNEDPDQIFDPETGLDILYWTENGAFPFGYYNNKMYVGNIRDTHERAVKRFADVLVSRDESDYAGRIWPDDKVLSFWEYPKTNAQMHRIIKDLESAIEREHGEKLNIWNQFDVEILVPLTQKFLKTHPDYDNSELPDGYRTEIIPVKDFKRSKRTTAKRRGQSHVLSPVAKNSDVYPGIGSKKRVAGLTPTQAHQMIRTSDSVIKLKQLVENPDAIYLPGKRNFISYSEDYAYAFGYYNDELYLDPKGGESHQDLNYLFKLEMHGYAREDFEYCGRFWTKPKVISFWEYPENNLKMKVITNELSNEYNKEHGNHIDIWNDFKVEILHDPDSGEISNSNTKFNGAKISREYNIKFIPVKDFKKSEKRPDLDLKTKHELSPVAKSNDIYNGIGSKKRPSGLTATQLHQLQRTSDSVIKLKSLIENTIAKVSKDINVKIDIDKTIHAGERQNRNGVEIRDSDIINIVKTALTQIANDLMFDELTMGSYVLITQISTDINIIGVLKAGENDEIDFIVVTVMKKKDFKPKRNTKVIFV